jgi:hypothetical protein
MERIVTNRITNIVAGIVLALLVVGCDKLSELSQPGPKEVLSSYLDASLKGRSEEAYGYVSSEDKSVKSLSEYKSENDKEDNPFAAVVVSNVSFKVLQVTETGSTAKADVEITLPDMRVIFKDLMGAAFSSAFGGKDQGEIEKELAEKYKTGEVPTTTKNQEFHLVEEDDGWKVFLDWKTEKAKKEKAEKVASLLSDAKELRKSNKLHGAVKKYEEALTLDSEMVEAREGLSETNQEIESFEEKQAYIKNVILKDFKVSEGKKYGFGKTVPGVFGTIVNNGDRTLKEVEITVYFLNGEGTVIGEEDFHPVLVSEYSFGDDNKPLKPNYVKDFGYSVEDYAPSAWSKKAKAKITNIEFE